MTRYHVRRWEPLRDLMTLQDEVTRLFEPKANGPAAWVPALDLFEGEQRYTVRMDLPGMRAEDIDVSVEDRVLAIQGERSSEEAEREGAVRIERRFGAFRRTLTLPADVEPDGIDASLVDGVLTVLIPKSEQAKPRKISVGSGTRTLDA